jgi:hypothetical protein
VVVARTVLVGCETTVVRVIVRTDLEVAAVR